MAIFYPRKKYLPDLGVEVINGALVVVVVTTTSPKLKKIGMLYNIMTLNK